MPSAESKASSPAAAADPGRPPSRDLRGLSGCREAMGYRMEVARNESWCLNEKAGVCVCVGGGEGVFGNR